MAVAKEAAKAAEVRMRFFEFKIESDERVAAFLTANVTLT